MADDIQELDISFLGDALGDGAEDEVDDEELSELTEEEDEGAAALEAQRASGGPAQWEAVDLVELDRVMLRVTAAAIPSADSKDVGTRLALQAAALEVDNSDLLGLGRIDPRQLTLTSRRRSGRRIEGENPEASSSTRRHALVTPENIAELRPKATTLPELLRGRQNLKEEVSERTGQLKALVKENFDRFISCKNTIDDIHKRLRKSEAHNSLSASGNSTSDMVVAISEVQDEAKQAFATLLARASNSDQVKSAVALLKRYEGLFQLPSRIRQSTARGELDQVIGEYKKARSLMDSMGAPNIKSVWHKLFTEVEKVVAEMVRTLDARLRDPETPQLVAIDAMRHILQLQSEHAASTVGMEPVGLYVQARDQHLRKQIEECMDRHKVHLQGVRQRPGAPVPWQPPADTRSKAAEAIVGLFRGAAPSPWHGERSAEAWLRLVRDLIQTVVPSLPDFWHVPQDKLNQLKAVPGALKVVLAAVDDGLKIAQDILRSFATKLHLALKELIAEGNDRSFYLSAVREIVSAFLAFKTTDTPPFVDEALQSLLEGASLLAIEQMTARVKQLTARIGELEDFEIIAISHKAGQPASKLPGMLRELLNSGMHQLEAVMEEGCRADSSAFAFNPIGKHAPALRHAFYDCFTQYAVATDQLWAAVSTHADRAPRGGPSRDAKLLVLHSNCVHVRTQVLRDLSARFHNLLTNDAAMAEAGDLQSEAAEDLQAVEGRLAAIYVSARTGLLDDVLEEYFEGDGTDWGAAPLPTGLRDAAFEIVNTLVTVQAEVYGIALSLQRRVMDELLQHLLSAYVTNLTGLLNDLSSGGTLQLLMEVQYLSRALGGALRPPRDALLDQARTALVGRVDDLARSSHGGSGGSAELERWCETIQGGGMGGRAEMVSGFLATDLLKATRLNAASFKA